MGHVQCTVAPAKAVPWQVGRATLKCASAKPRTHLRSGGSHFCYRGQACKAGSPTSFRSSSSLHCGALSSAHFFSHSPLLQLFGQSHVVPQHEFWHHRTWLATRKRG